MRWQAFVRSTVLLVGCLVVAAMTTACGRSDSAVQQELQQQLAADATTSGARLTVAVQEGIARLSGETETMAQQTRAVEIARSIKGVKDVQSQMRLNDAALQRAVKDAVAKDAEVSSIPLQIEVVDGEVRLMSDKTNADQRARLKTLVAGVPGVAHVDDRMK
jgi:osmotically-inducible protein OsmY